MAGVNWAMLFMQMDFVQLTLQGWNSVLFVVLWVPSGDYSNYQECYVVLFWYSFQFLR